jgi:hypothetical protein
MINRSSKIILFVMLILAIAYSDNHDKQDSLVCSDSSPAIFTSSNLDSIHNFPHQIHTISFIGAGIGHVNNSTFKQVSVDFFVSHLWEILSRCAVGIAGEYTTDINKSSLAAITGVVDLYPFRYGTTPYFGIETGLGYAQIPGKTDFGIAMSVETGILAIKVSNLLIGISARLNFFTIQLSGKRPLAGLLRVGILL